MLTNCTPAWSSPSWLLLLVVNQPAECENVQVKELELGTKSREGQRFVKARMNEREEGVTRQVAWVGQPLSICFRIGSHVW